MFQGPGTGPVKYPYTIILPDGTVLVPALAFATDPDTGLYLISDGNLGLTVAGVLRATLSATALTPAPDATMALGGAALRWAAGYFGGVANTIPITIKAGADQTANLQEWQSSGGGTLAAVDENGVALFLYITGLTPAKAYIYFNAGTGSVEINPGAATDKPLVVKGFSGQSVNLQEWQNATGDALLLVLPGGGVTINEQGLDSDTRIESDTEANMVLVDAGSDVVYLGGDTAGVKVVKGGDQVFVGAGSGLPFGCCHGDEIAWSQASMVQGTFYAISDADIADGPLNLVTHDGSGKLTVTEPGKYLATYAITAEMNGANNHCKAAFMVSGTATTQGEQHAQFVTANAEVNISSTTILDLADDAYVEVGVMNPDAGTPTITVDHLDLTLVQVGG